ncbi:AP2 domain-containing protein [Burkholderia stabilis]|uniref:AP2 domain-containing protein n=1 Tax=Burkholderia stabilis TaxID=95485 RepID=UPI003C7D59B0
MLGSLPISDTTSMPNDRVRRPDTSLEWHGPQESSRRPAPNRPVVAQQAGPLRYLQQSYATPGSIRRPATVAPISQQPIRTAQWQDPFPSAWDAPQPSCASVPGQTLSSDSTARDPSGAGAPLYDPGQSAPGQRGRMATSERDPVRASAFSPKPPRASILAEHAEYIDQSSARASQTEHNPSQPSAARPGSSVSAPPRRAIHQSSVTGVRWQEANQRWLVGYKGSNDKRTSTTFSVSQYGSVEAARRAAEEAAPGLRARTVMAAPRLRAARQSSVIGVHWQEDNQRWLVDYTDSNDKKTTHTFSVSRYGSVEAAQQAAEEAAPRLRAGTNHPE